MAVFGKQGLYGSFSIKQTVAAGFGLVLVVLGAGVIFALVNLATMETTVDSVVSEQQPAVIHSLRLSRALDHAVGALGFHLLSREEGHRQAYQDALVEVDAELATLRQLGSVRAHPQAAELVDRIEQGVGRFNGYRERMLELAADELKNIPASAFANGINDQSRVMLGAMSEFIENGRSLIDEEYSGNDWDSRFGRQTQEELIELAESLRFKWVRFMNDLRGFLAFRGASLSENMALYLSQSGELITQLGTYDPDILGFEQTESLEVATQTLQEVNELVRQVVDVHSSDRWRTDAWLIKTELGPLVSELKADLDQLVTLENQEIDALSASLAGQLAGARWLLVVLAVAGLGLGFVAARVTGKQILTLIDELRGGFRDLAGGDLTRRLAITSKGEGAEISELFNTAASRLQEVVGEVSGSMNQLSTASAAMAQVTERTSAGVYRQQGETQQVATAMTEMSASADEVARNAEHAVDSARSADEASHSGQTVVSDTIRSISEVSSAIDQVAQAMSNLGQDTDSIGAVLEVIGGISEQTNLLALNAAIEAARAGEQGRGFAVVADEVRTLASRTQQSTQEIQKVIEHLQTSAKAAAQAMESSRHKVHSSVDQAEKAGAALADITHAVASIRQMNSQIANAAEQQRDLAREVDRNIVNISEVAGETASGATETAESGQRLSSLAGQIQTLVARFQV